MRCIDADKLCKGFRKLEKHKDLFKKSTILAMIAAVENAPTEDVVPRAEVERLLEDFQRTIGADAKVGMSAGEILLHISNMLAELKKKYTGG